MTLLYEEIGSATLERHTFYSSYDHPDHRLANRREMTVLLQVLRLCMGHGKMASGPGKANKDSALKSRSRLLSQPTVFFLALNSLAWP